MTNIELEELVHYIAASVSKLVTTSEQTVNSIDYLSERSAGLEARMGSMEKKLDTVDVRTKVLETNMSDVQNSLAATRTSLEFKIAKLDSKISKVDESLGKKIKEHEAKTEAFADKAGTGRLILSAQLDGIQLSIQENIMVRLKKLEAKPATP